MLAASTLSETDFAPVHTTAPEANVSAVLRGVTSRIVAAVNFDGLYSRKGIDIDNFIRSRRSFKRKVLTTLSI